MNHGMIMGHLGADPDVKMTPSGTEMVVMRLAARQKRGNKENEEITIWWRVIIWGDRFSRMVPHLKKGSALIVFGDILNPEIYTTNDGQQRVSLTIVANNISFPPFGKERKEPLSNAQDSDLGFPRAGMGKAMETDELANEEVPF